MIDLSKFVHKWSWTILLVFCVAGVFFPAVGIAAIVCMLAPVIMSFFKGRYWCGNFCPRGSMNDIIISKISRKLRIPELLGMKWFRLLFLCLLMGGFAIQIFMSWGNINAVGMVFVRMIIITTALSIILGTIYNQRTWCRICPMGTLASYAAGTTKVKDKIKHVSFRPQTCIDCKICSRNCPMGIDVWKYKDEGVVTNPDCIRCKVCIDRCPKNSLYI